MARAGKTPLPVHPTSVAQPASPSDLLGKCEIEPVSRVSLGQAELKIRLPECVLTCRPNLAWYQRAMEGSPAIGVDPLPRNPLLRSQIGQDRCLWYTPPRGRLS
jgi:hypothetical protein